MLTRTTPDGLTEIGFWRTEKRDGPVPVPSKTSRLNEKDLISALIIVERYASAGNKKVYRGLLACRICGEDLGEHVEYISGDYKWRSDLQHYIKEHHVRQYPMSFSKHIVAQSADLTKPAKKAKAGVAAKSVPKKKVTAVEISFEMFSRLYWYLDDRSTKITAAHGYPDLEEIKKYLDKLVKEKNLNPLLTEESDDPDQPPRDKDSTVKNYKPTKKGLKIDDDDDDDDDMLEDITPLKSKKPKKVVQNVGFFDDDDDLTSATIKFQKEKLEQLGIKLRCVEADPATKKERDDSMETLCLSCSFESEPYEYTLDGFCWPDLLKHYMMAHFYPTGEPRFDKWLEEVKLDPEVEKQHSINTLLDTLGIDNKKKDEFAKLLKLLVSQ